MSCCFFFASNRTVRMAFVECGIFLALSLFAIQGAALAVSASGPAENVTMQEQAEEHGRATADFFVAADGKDSWSGTLPSPNSRHTDGPFASIARAQIAVRNLIQSHPRRPIIVMIRQGTYSLPLSPTNPGTLNFDGRDSGTSKMPVTWENYPGEIPLVSGGERIGRGMGGLGLTWTNPYGNLWQVKLPASTRPFEYLFYKRKVWARRMRSRLQSSTGVGYYMNNGSCYSTSNGQTVDISKCNLGTFLRIAAVIRPGHTGCPHVTGSSGSKCLDRFRYASNAPITRWVNLNGIYTGDPSKPCRADSSNPYPTGDIGLTLFGSWTADVMRINCVDTRNRIIYLTGPTQGSVGNYNCFGPAVGHRYIIENAKDAFHKEQQDGQTGIWFLDRSTKSWTLSYVAKNGENPNVDTVAIPQLQPATPTGGSIISAVQLNYVTFRGITFGMDDFIPPPAGFSNDDNGENNLPAAIDCESCQHVTFDGIRVKLTSASGLQIASLAGHTGPPAADDVIQNSAFYDLGDSGIHIGHAPHGWDRAASVVHSVTVQNNIVQGYGRVFPAGEGLAQGNGNNILYQHNDINDGYHAGISVCESGCPGANGSGIISQYNHIWNLIQGITSDGGAIFYLVGDGNRSGTGNKILNNLVHDVSDSSIIDKAILGTGYGGQGIYLDGQSAGVTAENNVVYHVSQSTVFIDKGPGNSQPANNFRNNIFAYGAKSMVQENIAWPQNCGGSTRLNLVSNIFYFDQNETKGFYAIQGCADSCGMSFDGFQNFQRNLYWRTDGQFATDSKAFHVLTNTPPPDQASSCSKPPNTGAWTFFDFPTWQTGHPIVDGKPLPMNEDSEGSVTVDPGFGHTGLPSDFLLSKSPVSGFDYAQTNKTIHTAGRTNPLLTPPQVLPTFPTYYYTAF